MTELEFIKETKEYYEEDTSRRALNKNGDCKYKIGDKKCAVGRIINEEAIDLYLSLEKISCGVHGIDSTLKIRGTSLEDVLYPEYRGFSKILFLEIQQFHDNDYHWDDKGLTTIGLEYYNDLLKKYDTNKS